MNLIEHNSENLLRTCNRYKLLLLLLVAVCCNQVTAYGQASTDTLEIKSLNESAFLLFSQGDMVEGEKKALDALNKANQINYPTGKLYAVINLTKINYSLNSLETALQYGIQAIDLSKGLSQLQILSDSYDQVAYIYQDRKLYTKALEYFQYSLSVKEQLNKPEQARLIKENMALCKELAKDIRGAKEAYEELLDTYYRGTPQEEIALLKLIELTELRGNWDDARKYNEQLLQYYLSTNSRDNVVLCLNNIGVLERKSKQVKNAEAYFLQAQELADSLSTDNTISDELQLNLTVNSAVVATNLNAYAKARKLLSFALMIAKEKRMPVQEANIYNHLAGNYYLSGINSLAKDYVEKAEAIAKRENANDVLVESYYLKYLLYLKKNDEKRAAKYKKLYEQTQIRKIDLEEASRKESIKDKLEADKEEASIRALIASKEEQARQLRQITLDAERRKKNLEIKDKELALLKAERELQKTAIINQRLEKERIQQRLALAEEEARNAKQKQKIALLQKDKELQELTRKEKERELELVNAKRKLDQEKLKEQELYNKGLAMIIGLFALLGIVLAIGYIQKRKDNKKIKKQKEEIEEKNSILTTQADEISNQNVKLVEQASAITAQNEELRQQSEEIMAQRDLNILQKEQIEESNHQIKQSIYSAKMIQNAILPTSEEFSSVFQDFFIIYQPKDIVSGDFYWMYQTNQYAFVVIADCTGHGVPGAFTCMIGNSLLNEIIGIKGITDPATILEELHTEINTTLKQEDTNIHTGMDLALFRKEKNGVETEITFSGAKRSLYYKLLQDNKLKVLSGDRRSIGGHNRKARKPKKPFTNQTVTLPAGSLIYAFSDGITDQHNEAGKKLGSKNLVEILEDVSPKSLDEQATIIKSVLKNHMEGVSQRDDILVGGFMV